VGSTFVVLVAVLTFAAIAPWVADAPGRLHCGWAGVGASLYSVPLFRARLAAIGITTGTSSFLFTGPADAHAAAPLAL
jgi:uncharacterized membrane-anchored protein